MQKQWQKTLATNPPGAGGRMANNSFVDGPRHYSYALKLHLCLTKTRGGDCRNSEWLSYVDNQDEFS